MITLKNTLYRFANKLFPKFDRILVIGSSKAESNAIEFANYLAEHSNKNIYFFVIKEFRFYVSKLLSS